MSIEKGQSTTPPSPDAVKREYETVDVSVRLMLLLVIGLVVLGILVGGGIWTMYRSFESRSRPIDEPQSVIDASQVPRGGVPLQPQQGHESTDAQDLRRMHQQEDATFAKLNWAFNETTGAPEVPAAVVEAVRHRSQPVTPSTQPVSGGEK